MGRNSTGALTTGEIMRIELSSLIKGGGLIKGRATGGILSWSATDSRIGYEACYTDKEKYVELFYTTTYHRDNSKRDFRYKVYLEAVPSNLGKGEVLYFICPETGQRCRILYKAYGSDIWKSREAYQNRIYYPLQQCSKLNRYDTKYWAIDKKLFNKDRKRVNATYKGLPTQTSLKNNRLWYEYALMEKLRWSAAGMPKRFHGIAAEIGY